MHPFRSEAERSVDVRAVVSEGARSTASVVRLPAGRRLQVGSQVPDSDQFIRKIDDRSGRSVSEAIAREVGTLWLTRGGPSRVPVSIVEGRSTRSLRIEIPPETTLVVGEQLAIEGRSYAIRALRALGRTVHGPGASYPARLVTRIYAGRTVTPPAGSRDWSRERETPSDRASSTSTPGRSRSSPGASRNRTAPRERSA